MKLSKIQMFTAKFKSIRMQEDETFCAFYYELSDVINSSFNLGEKILECKVLRKILRSFSERFKPKVIVIEENKEIDSMRVDELVGSLQTYVLNIMYL